MEPIQHPLSTQPASASRPISSPRMSVIDRKSVSGACTWQHPVSSLPRQNGTPRNGSMALKPALEGKIRFSARFRTERKAQAGIPALNQRGESRSLAVRSLTSPPGPPERSRPPCPCFPRLAQLTRHSILAPGRAGYLVAAGKPGGISHRTRQSLSSFAERRRLAPHGFAA